jgi:hypothetical protein
MLERSLNFASSETMQNKHCHSPTNSIAKPKRRFIGLSDGLTVSLRIVIGDCGASHQPRSRRISP